MARLTALAMPAGESFLATLESEWASGAAIAPIDHRLPANEMAKVIAAIAPTAIIDADGVRTANPDGREVEPGDALVVATSGSTGAPKAVVLSHDAVAASARVTSERLGIDAASDHWLCCLPVSHIGGLSVLTRALLTGTPVTVHDGFDAGKVMDAVRTQGVTRISLVTRALRQVDSAAFVSVLLGGAAPPSDRPANVIATYGSTETGSGVVYERAALDEVELRVDSGGQLWVRSPTLLRCYRDGVDPKDAEGWYPTGDAGSIVDGVLSVTGRMADVIVTGGEKVWPARIEPLLRGLGSVADVVVVGRSDPEWGHRVTAVVEPVDGDAPPTLQELIETVRASLPDWWAPKSMEVVDRLPRTPLGKIKRSEV